MGTPAPEVQRRSIETIHDERGVGNDGSTTRCPVEKYARDGLLLRIMRGHNETLTTKALPHLEEAT